VHTPLLWSGFWTGLAGAAFAVALCAESFPSRSMRTGALTRLVHAVVMRKSDDANPTRGR
jgi:hypothetical protein